MDNARNNDMFMQALKHDACMWHCLWHKAEAHAVCFMLQSINPYRIYGSYFPHIVNLTCKAILEAIRNLKNVAETAPSFEPLLDKPTTSLYEALQCDLISLIRALIYAVCTILYIAAILLIVVRFEHHLFTNNSLQALANALTGKNSNCCKMLRLYGPQHTSWLTVQSSSVKYVVRFDFKIICLSIALRLSKHFLQDLNLRTWRRTQFVLMDRKPWRCSMLFSRCFLRISVYIYLFAIKLPDPAWISAGCLIWDYDYTWRHTASTANAAYLLGQALHTASVCNSSCMTRH